MVDNVLVDVLEKGGDLSQLEKDLSESVQSRKVATAGAKKAAQKVETRLTTTKSFRRSFEVSRASRLRRCTQTSKAPMAAWPMTLAPSES
jgi:hypothetical protein